MWERVSNSFHLVVQLGFGVTDGGQGLVVPRCRFVPPHHGQVLAIDGVVDLCLAGLGLGGVLGVAQTRVGVGDGQIVRVQVPVSRKIPACTHRLIKLERQRENL